MTEVMQTLSSGTLTVPYMTMTTRAILCIAPVLERDFEPCRIPGGTELWRAGGFYSPGNCFVGYEAMCTQTLPLENGWPFRQGETVVRCVPEGYDCNDPTRDQRFAVTDFDGTILSAPAFEIRWRDEDLTARPHPGVPILDPLPTGPPGPGSSASSDRSSTAAVSPLSSSRDLARPRFVPTAGAVAGIAVGSSLGLVAMIMVILLLASRHRKRKLEGDAPPSDMNRQDDSQRDQAHITAHGPVELEHKPMEPKELSSDAQIPCEKPEREVGTDDRSGLTMHHISVNSDPAEMAGDNFLVPLSEGPSHRDAEETAGRATADHLETQETDAGSNEQDRKTSSSLPAP